MAKVEGLEAGQVDTNAQMAKLVAGQAKVEVGQADVMKLLQKLVSQSPKSTA